MRLSLRRRRETGDSANKKDWYRLLGSVSPRPLSKPDLADNNKSTVLFTAVVNTLRPESFIPSLWVVSSYAKGHYVQFHLW